MKIEKLHPQFCQQKLGWHDVCDEIAAYRISTDDKTVSVSYCHDHAVKFIEGKAVLSPILCTWSECRAILHPGYFMDDSSRPFCSVEHRGQWDQSHAALYR